MSRSNDPSDRATGPFAPPMTAGGFAKRAKAMRHPEATWPSDAEFDEMDGLQFLRFRLGEYGGAERAGMAYALDEARIHAVEVDRAEQQEKVSEQNSRNASTPRPTRQHPRKPEAMAMALAMHDRRPDLSRSAIGVQVAERMEGDDTPNPEVISRWISFDLRRRQKV